MIRWWRGLNLAEKLAWAWVFLSFVFFAISFVSLFFGHKWVSMISPTIGIIAAVCILYEVRRKREKQKD